MKEESVENIKKRLLLRCIKEMLIFTISRLAMKSLPQKRDEEHTSENNEEFMLF